MGLFVACLTSGCGTLINQSPPMSMLNVTGERRPHRAYGGVRTDVELAKDSVATVLQGEKEYRSMFLVPLLIAVDLPLSAVTDTVLLPWDLKAELKWRREGKPSPKVTPAPSPEPDRVGRIIVEGETR